MTDKAAGWEPDPTGRFDHRYWDGSKWTDNVANAGVAATDPFDAAPSSLDPSPNPDASQSDDTVIDEPIGLDEPAGWAAPGAPQSGADPTSEWPIPPSPGMSPGMTSGPSSPMPPVPPFDPSLAAGAAAGSRKGVMIAAGVLVALAVVAVGLLLTGDDDDDGERNRIRRGIAGAINEDSDLTAKQANCIADAIIDKIGTTRLKDVDFSADEPPADMAADITSAAMGSLTRCGIDLAEMMGDLGNVSGGDNPFGGDVNLPPGFDEQLAEIYENGMGLPRAKARCLAEKILAAINSGDLSEEEAMSEFFAYFAACNIDMNEFGQN